MIRWIREKFKGKVNKKYRKYLREIMQIDKGITKLQKERKKTAAKILLMEKIFKVTP